MTRKNALSAASVNPYIVDDAIPKKKDSARACGVNAIESDELGRAKINNEKVCILRYVYGKLSFG